MDGQLVGWLDGWSVGWLDRWMVGWLVGRSVGRLAFNGLVAYLLIGWFVGV